jgi:hypothetical protein
MYELLYVLEDHFHILVIYCMDLWEINDDDDQTTWHYIPEDRILHSHYIKFSLLTKYTAISSDKTRLQKLFKYH